MKFSPLDVKLIYWAPSTDCAGSLKWFVASKGSDLIFRDSFHDVLN